MKLDDLTGKRYGRLIVVKRGTNKNKKTRWLCKCDCGNYKEIGATELKNGTTKSCGCYNIEKLKLRAKHNMCDSRLYSIWRCMKYRCKGTKNPQSYLYKDRGIKLYDPWNDFNNFYEWAKDKYFDGSSIDRIDVNGNYEPSNCRFVDNFVQANNKRNNIFLEFNGEKKTLSEWSKKAGINYFCLRSRYLKGWNIERMLTEKTNKGQNNLVLSKKVDQYDLQDNFIKTFPSTKEVERQLGIQTTLISRCCRGLQKTAYGYKWKYADEELQK